MTEQETKLPPLHQAAADGNIGNINYRLVKGDDVNAVDGNGDTPLHWASRKGQRKAALHLIKRSADMYARNNDDKMPLQVAIDEHGVSSRIALLLHLLMEIDGEE